MVPIVSVSCVSLRAQARLIPAPTIIPSPCLSPYLPSCYEFQAGLRLVVLLPLSPLYWSYKPAPPSQLPEPTLVQALSLPSDRNTPFHSPGGLQSQGHQVEVVGYSTDSSTYFSIVESSDVKPWPPLQFTSSQAAISIICVGLVR